MKYVKKLRGARVYLSPMCAQDAQQYYEWLNDPAVTDGVGTTANVMSLEGEQRWLAENAGDYQFAIVLEEGDRLSGNCGIKEIDWKRRCGEVGLFLGNEADRGKGYGKALLTHLAQLAVERGCGRLEWSCLDWNQPSIDFYLSMGAQRMDDWTTYRLTGDRLAELGRAE